MEGWKMTKWERQQWKRATYAANWLAWRHYIKRTCKEIGVVLLPADSQERREVRKHWKTMREVFAKKGHKRLHKLIEAMSARLAKQK
jgi:hypothetical protein